MDKIPKSKTPANLKYTVTIEVGDTINIHYINNDGYNLKMSELIGDLSIVLHGHITKVLTPQKITL